MAGILWPVCQSPLCPQIRGFCLLLPLHSQLHLAPSPLWDLPFISISSLEILPSHPEGIPWQSGWLGLCSFTAEGPSSVPGWGTRIPQASRQGQKEEGVCAAEPLFVQAALTSSTLTRTPIPTPFESSLGVLCGHVELCVFCQLSSLPHPVRLLLFYTHSVPWVQGNTL